jgi:hypothetical protein
MTTLSRQAHPAVHGIRPGCHAVIDTGDGPRTVLIASAGACGADDGTDADADADKAVVPTESPLGRALLGARVGDRVRFRAPAGPRMVRVIAIRR